MKASAVIGLLILSGALFAALIGAAHDGWQGFKQAFWQWLALAVGPAVLAGVVGGVVLLFKA